MVVEIEGLWRGLVVLETLQEYGPLSLTELGKHTPLPLATVTRCLKTLQSAGYVRRGVWETSLARDHHKKYGVLVQFRLCCI